MSTRTIIPGYPDYRIERDAIYSYKSSKVGRKLKKVDKIKKRYRLYNQDGCKCQSIHKWRELAGLPPLDTSFKKEDLLKKTKKQGNCLIWTGAQIKCQKVGRCSQFGLTKAHEVAYFLKTGITTTGVVQTCGNRLCVCEDHLKEGDKKEQIEYETKRHLKGSLIISKLSDKYVVDTRKRVVYHNNYERLTIKKPNYRGMYSVIVDTRRYYLDFDAFVTGNLNKLKSDTTFFDRFWEKVDKGGPDDCWEWTGALSKGYGSMGDGTSLCGERRAHRIAWVLMNGSIPEGKMILHSCHNSRCVNPFHLRVGTHEENMEEMMNAGRSNRIPFPESRKKKLSEQKKNGVKLRDVRNDYPEYSESTIEKHWRSIDV